MKKKIMVWKNKVEQLFANRRSIQTIIGLVAAVIIMTAVTKFLIAFFQFLQKYYIKILLLIAYIITAHVYDKKWKEKRVKEKNQTNRAVDNKKAKKITYNNLLFVVHELGILRSKLSNIILIITDIFNLGLSKELYITLLVSRELFDPTRGNPLRLKKGQHQPAIRCEKRDMNPESYVLKIILDGFPANEIRKLAPVISSALIGEVNNYAVTSIQEDITSSVMYFIIEDVAIDHRLVFSSVEEMRPPSNTKLLIDTRTILDLTASGSILLSAKTRSGKTTGIVALAIQLLMCGPDQYGSEVLIIDPKRAELSLLPYTVTVKEDENGEGRAILAAVQRFADSITTRQSVLNALSEADGDAVHWWEAAMHPSFLVLDEFVTIRTLFPKRPDKSDSDYCLASFDALLKRIVTMGASAGCYVIISIAEASVEEGGLPSMLRSAMSTKILFRPTKSEARLLWSSEKYESLPDRTYQPGDAWFSSTDGKHDNDVSFVRFPQMNFPIYKELGRLLKEYYSGTGASGEAEREPPARPAEGGPT